MHYRLHNDQRWKSPLFLHGADILNCKICLNSIRLNLVFFEMKFKMCRPYCFMSQTNAKDQTWEYNWCIYLDVESEPELRSIVSKVEKVEKEYLQIQSALSNLKDRVNYQVKYIKSIYLTSYSAFTNIFSLCCFPYYINPHQIQNKRFRGYFGFHWCISKNL